MDATMSLRLDKNLKVEFSNYAKWIWLEPSFLIRKFMYWCLKRKDSIKIDISEELFDEVVLSKKSLDKLDLISNKLEKLWY